MLVCSLFSRFPKAGSNPPQPTSSPSCYRLGPPRLTLTPRGAETDVAQERIVCLYGSIDDSTAASIVSQLLWLEADNPDKPITLYINSPGGMISSGMSSQSRSFFRFPSLSACEPIH